VHEAQPQLGRVIGLHTSSRIVIVEDAPMRELLAEALAHESFAVTAFDRVPDAGEIVALDPQLVIIGLHLDGTDWDDPVGLRVATALRRDAGNDGPAILVLTADTRAPRQYRAEFKRLNIHVLGLPFDLDALHVRVAGSIEANATASSARDRSSTGPSATMAG
jgi:DNA-binding response OmpR family regulator